MSASGGISGPIGTPVSSTATNANALTVATLPAVAGKTNYCTGFEVTGGGATAAIAVLLGINNIVGGNLAYSVIVPAGVGVPLTPLVVEFNPPLPANGVNVAIPAVLPAFGAGNLAETVVIHGYVL